MEDAVCFYSSSEKRLYGILHLPDAVSSPSSIVIVLTGGPQVRTGAHRLYVELSRHLASRGVASLRFDYEGLGDSDGEFVGFTQAGPSIEAAIHYLKDTFGQELKIFIWSLCDGSTAALLYAVDNQDLVQGIILCNPYLPSEGELARATIKHYYWIRFLDLSFWKKLFGLKVNVAESFSSLLASARAAGLFRGTRKSCSHAPSLAQDFVRGLNEYSSPVRIILSRNDIVAATFLDLLKKYQGRLQPSGKKWGEPCMIEGANHTFTDPNNKKQLFQITLEYLEEMNFWPAEDSL